MHPQDRQVLEYYENLLEENLYQEFVQMLQEPARAGPQWTSGAPWEWLVWAYQETFKGEFRTRLARCVERLLDDILCREAKDVLPGETLHLGTLVAHLQMRRMRERLRRLVDQTHSHDLIHDGIDIREQLLYHLESLGHLDSDFWKNEIEQARFAGPAFLALTHLSKEYALLYLPYLVDASIEIGDYPLADIIAQALERPGMDGFSDRVNELFSVEGPMPADLPKRLREAGESRNLIWRDYCARVQQAFDQIGVPGRSVTDADSTARSNSNEALGLVRGLVLMGIVCHRKALTQSGYGRN